MPATRFWSSADLEAVIARVTPEILALLGDGMPRAEAAIVAALAGRHPKDEVTLTLMRLDVLGQLDLRGGRYTLATAKAEPAVRAPGLNPPATVVIGDDPARADRREPRRLVADRAEADDGGTTRHGRHIASPARPRPRGIPFADPTPRARASPPGPQPWIARRPCS
jgi:hypothetical protein